MKKIFFFIIVLSAASCGAEKKQKLNAAVSTNVYDEGLIGGDTLIKENSEKDTAVTNSAPDTAASGFWSKITNGSTGFGYEIYNAGKLIIRQPHIPAVQGMREFASREDASRVAEIVMEKLRKGVNPPSVSLDELKMAGVIK